MTKAELIEKIHARNGRGLTRRDVAALVDVVFEQVTAAVLASGRFVVPGFGTFVVRRRSPRVGRNPRTGERMEIPATSTIVFKPAAELKEGL